MFNKSLIISFFMVGILFGQMFQIGSNDPLVKIIERHIKKDYNLINYRLLKEDGMIPTFGSIIKIDSAFHSLRLNPNIYFNDEGSQNKIIISGFLNFKIKNIDVLIEPKFVNNEYSKDLLGTKYNRFSFTGRIFNSYLRYKNDDFLIFVGRRPVWWGESWSSSIVQSSNQIPYDNILLIYQGENFSYELLNGQLSSVYDGSSRIRRNISGHRFTYWGNNFVASFGDQVIYSGHNRSLELFYANPFVPVMLANIDNEEGSNINTDDNFMLFFTGRYNFKKNLSIFSELIIDDFQVDRKNKDIFPNATGFKIGINGSKFEKNKFINYEINYTQIGTWTYTHENYYNNWFNFNQPIGNQNGPDLKSINIRYNYFFSKNVEFKIENIYSEIGSINILDSANPENTTHWNFPSPEVNYVRYINTELSYYIIKSDFIFKTSLFLDSYINEPISIGLSVQIGNNINLH